MLIVIGEIIQELIVAHERNKDADLNKIKTRLSSKYNLDSTPRLVDIIAAVPQDAKNILLPKLKAKPIRTASGVILYESPMMFHHKAKTFSPFPEDCCCGGHVQTPSMPAHQYDR